MKLKNIITSKVIVIYLNLVLLTGMLSCNNIYAEEDNTLIQLPHNIEYTTIKALKNNFPKDSISSKITEDIYLNVKVTANDVSGNIYKKLYVSDGTGGIYLSLDQTYLSTIYPVGSKLIIHLKDLYLIKKWNQIFIGHRATKNNLLPKDLIKSHIKILSKDKKATPIPEIKKINELNNNDDCKLITIKNVIFKHQGNSVFYDEKLAKSNYTNQYLNDGTGEIIVPISKYFKGIQGQNLPITQGDITGIATRFGNRWQIIIRDLNDIDFPEDEHIILPQTKKTNTLFFEDFGIPQKIDYRWPKVKEYRNFHEKSPIVYKDKTNDLSIVIKNNHSYLYFPEDRLVTLEIEGLNIQSEKSLTLEIDFIINSQANYNLMEVFANDRLIDSESYIYKNNSLIIKLNNLEKLNKLKIQPKLTEHHSELYISTITIY